MKAHSIALFTSSTIIWSLACVPGSGPSDNVATDSPNGEAATLSVDVLRHANPRSDATGAKGRPRTADANGPTVALETTAPAPAAGIDSLVTFSGQFTTPGFDSSGNPQSVWPFQMVGGDPSRGGTTTINAPIIPVVLDLLAADGTVAATLDPRGLVQPVVRSPIFGRFPYVGGTSQFADGMMRAQFWDRIHRANGSDNGYHLALQPSVKTARRMQIPSGSWFQILGANGKIQAALVESGTFARLLFPATLPVNASSPIGAAELAGEMTTRDVATLLFDNVFLFDTTVSNCCRLGFHSYDFEPGDASNGNRERRFVMTFASWVDNGLFQGTQDVTAVSHEIAEAVANPFVANQTPWWLSLDPFFGFSLCQNTLETGDVTAVLTSGAVSTIPLNGRTYHPANVALLPWFASQSPSPALGGSYSFPDETALTALSPRSLGPGCVPQ